MTDPIPLQQPASGSRVYVCDTTWKTVGRYIKLGYTGRDDLSQREENLAREYGEAQMIISCPGTPTTEKWWQHQFAHDRLSREVSGKLTGWHPTELYWPGDGLCLWILNMITLSRQDNGFRIECGSREIAYEIVLEIYRERWNRGQWEDEAA